MFKVPTFAFMQKRKKTYGLLALWFLMAALVVLVWLFHENKKIASVYLVAVDGELMEHNWQDFTLLVDSLSVDGILLEADTLGVQPEFGRLAGPALSAKIKSVYPKEYFGITPDSLYQKAFANTIRRAVDKLDESAYQLLISNEKNSGQERVTALLADETERIRILNEMHQKRVLLLGPRFEAIPDRYAGLLMQSLNKLLVKHPGKRWLVLVDIEKYPWIKTRLIKDQRIEVLNEIYF